MYWYSYQYFVQYPSTSIILWEQVYSGLLFENLKTASPCFVPRSIYVSSSYFFTIPVTLRIISLIVQQCKLVGIPRVISRSYPEHVADNLHDAVSESSTSISTSCTQSFAIELPLLIIRYKLRITPAVQYTYSEYSEPYDISTSTSTQLLIVLKDVIY